MNSFTKNVMGLVAAVCALGGLWFGAMKLIDEQFGDGTTVVISAVLFGVLVTAAIWTIATYMTNQSHQSAGADITDFSEALSRTQRENFRVQREIAASGRYDSAADAQIRLMDYKRLHQMAEEIAAEKIRHQLALPAPQQPPAQDDGYTVFGWSTEQPVDGEFRFYK